MDPISAACLASAFAVMTGGGFTGGGKGDAASFRVADLPPNLQAKVCQTLDPGLLQALSKQPTKLADGFTYSFEVTDATGATQTYIVSEEYLSPEATGLMHVLAGLYPLA